MKFVTHRWLQMPRWPRIGVTVGFVLWISLFAAFAWPGIGYQVGKRNAELGTHRLLDRALGGLGHAQKVDGVSDRCLQELRDREATLGRVESYQIRSVDVELLGTPWGVDVVTKRGNSWYREVFGGTGLTVDSAVECVAIKGQPGGLNSSQPGH